jgi:hypothetical protein
MKLHLTLILKVLNTKIHVAGMFCDLATLPRHWMIMHHRMLQNYFITGQVGMKANGLITQGGYLRACHISFG